MINFLEIFHFFRFSLLVQVTPPLAHFYVSCMDALLIALVSEKRGKVLSRRALICPVSYHLLDYASTDSTPTHLSHLGYLHGVILS